MSRARLGTNLLLMALVLVLGAMVLLLPEPRPPLPPPAVEFEPASIDRITLRRLDEREALRLERRDGDWYAVRPAERRVDSGRVARALAVLRTRTESCYPAVRQEPREFGLAPPQAELQLDSIEVAFGYRTPDGRRYIRAQGRLCLVDDISLPILAAERADAAGDD